MGEDSTLTTAKITQNCQLLETLGEKNRAFSPHPPHRPLPAPSSPPSLGFRDRAELLDSTFLRMGMLAVLRSRYVCTRRIAA